ncbi:hypothetical protein [Nocardia sp. NBC_00511]|uniref:hypothetical protein n=1 Tax=Nocardia sp. NBC_00511 TaxID=2903591 RepID=UPI002F917EF4
MSESWRTWLPEQAASDLNGEDLDNDVHTEEPFVDDDPLREIAADVRRRAHTSAVRRHAVKIAGIATAAAAVAGAALLTVVGGHGDSQAATPAKVAAPTSTAPAWCAESHTPTTVVGHSAGKAPGVKGATGPDLILYQQYAWYVLRDANTARSVLAPDAAAADPDQARAAVAAIPAGTRYCVTITTLKPTSFDVQIDERHPDGTSAHWQQAVTTGDRDGHTMITAITAGGDA